MLIENQYRDSLRYSGAPADGSPWLEANGGDCTNRFLRDGCWVDAPGLLRSASRFGRSTITRYYGIGFRVARTTHFGR
jgi:formylglycine-generating enzyme required for sulfatase activity